MIKKPHFWFNYILIQMINEYVINEYREGKVLKHSWQEND